MRRSKIKEPDIQSLNHIQLIFPDTFTNLVKDRYLENPDSKDYDHKNSSKEYDARLATET